MRDSRLLKRKRELLVKYHQHSQVEWSRERDYSEMKRSRRTITIGVLYPRISLHNEYEAYGENEDGALIRVCIPRAYFLYNRLSSGEQIMWEIKRLSFTRVADVLVFNNPNPEPNDYGEMLCICPHQTIHDTALPEPLSLLVQQVEKSDVAVTGEDTDAENKAVCTHYTMLLDPKLHRDFPDVWPTQTSPVFVPDKFNGFNMFHSHFNTAMFLLERPPAVAKQRRKRLFVLKPVMPEIDPYLPLEGYSSRFGLVSGKARLSMHMEYIEASLFVQCYRLDALPKSKWPVHPAHVYEKGLKHAIATIGKKRSRQDSGGGGGGGGTAIASDAGEHEPIEHAAKRAAQ